MLVGVGVAVGWWSQYSNGYYCLVCSGLQLLHARHIISLNSYNPSGDRCHVFSAANEELVIPVEPGLRLSPVLTTKTKITASRWIQIPSFT